MRRPRAWLPLAAAACLVYYGPRLRLPFVWDDLGVLALNLRLREPAAWADYLRPAYFELSREQSWRPLATLSYRALARAGGGRPEPFRAASLALHLLAGLLLYRVGRAYRLGASGAAAAAAVFLLHPAHLETVLIASFNEELLAAALLLAMLLAHERARRPGGRPWSGAAAACYGLALLAKESALLAWPLLLLSDKARDRPRPPPASLTHTLCLAAAALFCALRFWLFRGPVESGACPYDPPLNARLYFAARGAAAAARVLLFPADLSIEYFTIPPGSTAELAGTLAAGLLALLAAAALAAACWRGPRRLFGFALWPVAFLAPTLNLVPVCVLSLRFMAERWLYLPAAGLCLAGGRWLAARPGRLAAVLLLELALALARLPDWRGEAQLWAALARDYPRSARAREGLGEALYRAGAKREALAEFLEALRLRESGVDPVLAYARRISGGRTPVASAYLYRWIGRLSAESGRLAAAELAFRRAVALEPEDPLAYWVMSEGLAGAGRRPEARAWAAAGLRLSPSDPLLRRIAEAGD